MNTTAAAPPSSTLAPAIEPANQPIPPGSAAANPLLTHMSKASAGGGGDASEEQKTADPSATNSTSSNATPVANVRILKKTMSTDSMLTDDRTIEPGMSSSGGGTPNGPGTKQRKYERKTKRFIWPDELHRLFIAAIFDVGLKNASPKALLGLMEAAGPNSGLTTEHLKSHLQKYRLNYERSRAEFLEFYDYSHKKNHKRRRKNGNKPGEPNTMFVFPIAHKKKKEGSGDSDSDDEGPDDGMSDSTLEHATPRSSSASLERAGSFTSMMHDPKEQMNAAAIAYAQQQQQQYLQMMNAGGASDRVSFNGGMASNQATAYASGQPRKGSLSGSSTGSTHQPNTAVVMNNRAIAAAAAAYQRYGGIPMGAGGSNAINAAIGQMGGDMNDPQWNILSSLMSPHITGVNSGNVQGGGGGGSAMIQPSEGMGGGNDQFQLQDEANDLQLQMHLAMQAQMNLHRQMLTRKVEVSQHINNNAGNNANFGGAGWSPQQQQQQQYFEQQRAARQALANSSHHPQQMSLAAASAAGISHTPRPSLAPRTSSSGNVLATSGPMATSTSMGMDNMQQGRPPIPMSVGPAVTMPNTMMQEDVNASSSGTLGANLGFDKNAPGAVAAGSAAAGGGGEDDSLDLYRWDRIDLNVELDDDDLFGFLKS